MENVISKVEVQKRHKDRVNVYVNDEFLFACNTELVYTYDLKKGKKIDLDSIKEVVEEDNYLKGKNYALNIIEKTYKTESQIREKLYKKQYSDKEIDRIINFLKEYKFLDDNKYVTMYVKDNIKSYGKNKIKFNLIRRGVDEKLINPALDSVSSEVEYKTAYKLGESKYKSLIKLDKDPNKNINKIYKKLGDFLIRRGYDFQIVNEVVSGIKNNYQIEYKNEENLSEDKCFECINEDMENEEDELLKLAMKRYAIISKREEDYVKIYRRLASYLMRRGYSYEKVSKTLKNILKDENI